jgi:AMIN domain
MVCLLKHSSASVKDFPPDLPYRQPLRCGTFRNDRSLLLALTILFLGSAHVRSQISSGTPSKVAVSSPKSSARISIPNKIAAVRSFRIVQEKSGQAVEILSTRPLMPSIQAITDPDRVVIDLPNARLETQQKRIKVQADQISTIRANQFQQNPPVARVVVDLLAPRAYTWDAAGNRLVVHLGRSSDAANSPFQAPTVASLTSAPKPAVSAVRTSGPLAIALSDSASGSSFTAGPDTTVLRLSSGGEVRVCPGTTVSVTPSESRHNVMFSMNAGALEAHFALDASSDSVMTPDFLIRLVGPGEFHYAISADHQGNTCVRALPGNTTSAIVSELLGDRSYQIKATDQLVFRSGQLDRVDMAVPLECGCPPTHDSTLRVSNDIPRQTESAKPTLPLNIVPPTSAEKARVQNAHSTPAPPASNPPDSSSESTESTESAEVHVQVEAPFVFRATGPAPAPVEDVATLPLGTGTEKAPAIATAEPPTGNDKSQRADSAAAPERRTPPRGFFRKVGGFFAALFH